MTSHSTQFLNEQYTTHQIKLVYGPKRFSSETACAVWKKYDVYVTLKCTKLWLVDLLYNGLPIENRNW